MADYYGSGRSNYVRMNGEHKQTIDLLCYLLQLEAVVADDGTTTFLCIDPRGEPFYYGTRAGLMEEDGCTEENVRALLEVYDRTHTADPDRTDTAANERDPSPQEVSLDVGTLALCMLDDQALVFTHVGSARVGSEKLEYLSYFSCAYDSSGKLLHYYDDATFYDELSKKYPDSDITLPRH